MILEKLMSIFESITSEAFAGIPSIQLQFLVNYKLQFQNVLDTVGRCFDYVNYFVPLDVFLGLEAISFSFILFKVGYTIFLRIKSMVPTWGN